MFLTAVKYFDKVRLEFRNNSMTRRFFFQKMVKALRESQKTEQKTKSAASTCFDLLARILVSGRVKRLHGFGLEDIPVHNAGLPVGFF